MWNRLSKTKQLDWPRGLVTAGLLVTAVWMLSGCTNRLYSEHGQAQGFEPVWDKLVVEVAAFEGKQPTGVAVSRTGRTFVTFPWWDKRPDPAVAELMPDGTLKPYPSEHWNSWDGKGGPSALRGFVSAQALYIDKDENLWVLDSGSPRYGSHVVTAGPKLFKIDLKDDSIKQVFYFDHKRDFTTSSSLSDFRVDPARQTAYISDSSRGTIYVVNLKTRQTHHVLLGDPSTSADAGVIARVGSREWRNYTGMAPQVNVSGLELSKDGGWLYYHTMSGRRIYRVPTNVLRDTKATDATRSAMIEDLGPTGSVVDGMWLDDQDNLYLAAIERDAIIVRRPSGAIETFVADPRLKWPDSLAMGADGYLYFTTSMRHLHWPYRVGSEIQEPYFVMKASPDKVARANVSRQIADEKQREAAWYIAQADEADRLAKIAAEQAQAERELAEARARLADKAGQKVDQAAQAHEETVNVIEKAAAKQQDAAKRAKAIAKLAKLKAAEASKAAAKAEEAARIARKLAAVAAEKMKQTRLAQAESDQSAAQAAAARKAHGQAVAAAHAAAKALAEAERVAQSLSAEAATALAMAEKAEKAAMREQLAAEELRDRALDARSAALLAERLATDAEYAELNANNNPTTGTADVPTQTD